MGDKIVIGPINKGLREDRTAFVIDDDSFPTLINAYQWRGRVKRKRGTSFLCRLTRYFNSNSVSYSPTATISLVAAAGNILTGFSLQSNGNIVPGTVTLVGGTDGTTYTDPAMNGVLLATGGTGTGGTINYATGAITIASGGTETITAIFTYYPDLPVMGLEDFVDASLEFPSTIAFDTTYSYKISNNSPYASYDVSFYKNPASATYVDYIAKTVPTPVKWNGGDYQQFWTVNYQGALWTTNGVPNPFVTTNIGMQYKPIVAVTVTAGGPAGKANLQITAHGLTVGDFLYINEVVTTTGINFQTGYVITVTDANNVIVEFPNATIATNGTGGIAQYLTRSADSTKDGIRWYDGDPTNGANPPVLSGTKGWVNFSPPLSQAAFSISDLPAAIYYLCGCKMIVPFKDFLLFIGPVVQTSAASSQKYLEDTIIWSQNGTPYYTSSYTNTPTATVYTPAFPTNVFSPILVPTNQTATAPAYFEDQSGFGGYLDSGIDQSANTCSSSEDVQIIGFDTVQTRLIYTGNDLLPFNLFVINSEYGSSSTFSSINLDKGVLSRGSRGYVITTQTGAQRIDLQIPDEVFEVRLLDNGSDRICAQRDFISEWVYFTYPSNSATYKFPTRTLQYNYRDDSWAIFNESYTTYGIFRKVTGFTWATIGTIYPTWESWNDPWNAGQSNLLNPQVIAGNQQGFVMIRENGTNESNSLYIKSISGGVVTAPDHCLNDGDYIIISGIIGTLSSINGNIYQIGLATQNTFTTSPTIPSGTYLGGGLIKRMYVPLIQTKQFPTAWGISRKTRLGVQQYLFTTTSNGQVTILIFLSQNDTDPYNTGGIEPGSNVTNGSLIYSTLMYTCPESTNLGLTPANVNLNLVTALRQSQTWHRMNTSLIGDTVQLGITLNDTQMRDTTFSNQFTEIELHSIILDVNASQLLC